MGLKMSLVKEWINVQVKGYKIAIIG